jgi:recombination protein RecR
MRLFEPGRAGVEICNICDSATREAGTLMVVEKDVDVENIERTGAYKGLYFVLGGTASLVDKDPERFVRIKELITRISNTTKPVQELIMALSATTEGEDTEAYVRERIASHVEKKSIRVSVLGRGLSTGTELEYVDADTMKSALIGRHAA